MKIDLPLGKAAGPAVSRPAMAKQAGMLIAAALISTAAGYAGYQRFGSPAAPVAAPQTVQARMGSLVSTVTSTGSVVATHLAKLSFSADGKLVEMNVAVGANVKAGQPLARQDTAPLQASLVSAESALKVAQINMEQLKAGATADELEAAQISYDMAAAKYAETAAGATAADIQAAQAAVDQAASNLASAQVKLDELKAGPLPVDVVSAQGAVASAKAAVAVAQAKAEDLKAGPTATDLETAQAAVVTGLSNLASAQSKLDLLKEGPTAAELAAAQAAVQSAKGSMITAEDKYQMVTNGELSQAGGTSNSAVQQAYNSARANYDSAVQKLKDLQEGPTAADLQAAQSAVTATQASYNAAVAKLDLLKKGPVAADLISSESSVEQAKVSLATAQAKLDDLVAGPTSVELAAAQSTVDQAKATLTTAQVKLNDLLAGPKATDLLSARSALVSARIQLAGKTTVKESDVILQEEKVRQAQATLDQAKLDLDSATMTAPFDGIVSAVSVNAGERVASNGTVITLVDPTAFRIDVVVDETDVAKLRAGQTAAITFDALPDQRLQGKVISVAPSGVTSQGVVNYPVSISVENPSRNFPAGMSAAAVIETERKDNVMLVPNRAVRTQGRTRIVDVMVGDKPETRTVQVGSSDETSTEIVSNNIKEGEMVIIPATSISAPRGVGGGAGIPGVPAVKVQGRQGD